MKNLIIILLILLLPSLSYSQCLPGEQIVGTYTITWTATETNEDGSAITDLAGYRVHSGVEPGVYVDALDVGNVLSYNLDVCRYGPIYIAVTAYDFSGNESQKSNEVSKTIEPPPDTTIPGVPGSVTITTTVTTVTTIIIN